MATPKIKLKLPSWMALLYITLSLITIPWTIALDRNLPPVHIFTNWNTAWAGLDLGITVALLLTGILALKKSVWVIMAACITGSFLLVDAWFDMASAGSGRRFMSALMLAVLIELPLAFLSFSLARKATKRNISNI